MKWRVVGVFLFFIFVISLFRSWGLGPGGRWVFMANSLAIMVIPVAFPIASVFLIAVYRKKSLAIPFLFYLIAFFFTLYFQSWGTWEVKTMFWYWTGAILACLFAIVSIISMGIFWKRNLMDKSGAAVAQIFGLVSNVGIILWVVFVIIAGQSGM